jgi:peptidylprolyl isomerase
MRTLLIWRRSWRSTSAIGRKSKAPPLPTVRAATQPGDWRAVDPENVVVIDSSKGRIIVELAPKVAPKNVGRIRQLARSSTL